MDAVLTAIGLLALIIITGAGVVAYALGRVAGSLDMLTAAVWARAREAAHRR